MPGHVFIATSLDGLIARRDGSIDWLVDEKWDTDTEEDFGFSTFMSSIDAIVMGRNTYDTLLSFDSWPYGRTPMFVLTHRPIDPPHHDDADVRTISGSPESVMSDVVNQGMPHVYVDGGNVIHQFLRAGLIERMIITRIPVRIGDGIPLFDGVQGDTTFHHVRTEAFSNGLVQSEYLVDHPQDAQ